MPGHRSSITFSLGDQAASFRAILPHWMMRFRHGCLLDGSRYAPHGDSGEPITLAVSDGEGLLVPKGGQRPFERLRAYQASRRETLFGFLSYDLKNHLEQLDSHNPDGVGMPLMHFFSPDIQLRIRGGEVTIASRDIPPEEVLEGIRGTERQTNDGGIPHWQVQSRETEEDYKRTIAQIKEHIAAGDIYEMNYCTEFFIESCVVCPAALYERLSHIASAPFAAFYKCGDKYLICGSPERFMKKTGSRLISQPIKGTAPRGTTPESDQSYKEILRKSTKDRAENVMIVDLVRNDLAKVCRPGTVRVDELFGIHGFERVWHMVSTVSGELCEDAHFTDAIRAAFPMGSMTGAPKVMAMKLIEKYEKARRGLYSGSVGYITPGGDFDFNVVIRSILYNGAERYLSYQVGGAIVYDSDPDGEYRECMLKAGGIRKALGLGETDLPV